TIKVYCWDLRETCDCPRELTHIAIDEIIEVTEDPAARAVRQDGRKHLLAGADDQLIPHSVEKCLVFLDRAAEGNAVIVHVSPRRRAARGTRVVQPSIGIQKRVLDIPSGRA